MIDRFIVGDTIQLTIVNSGASMTGSVQVYDGSESLVSSIALSSSGDGHYYAFYTTPSTDGYYVANFTTYINSLPYVRRKMFMLTRTEVD